MTKTKDYRVRQVAVWVYDRYGLLFIAAAAIAVLHYYGRLHFQAALLIGSAFAFVGAWLYALKQFAAFRPYRLTIGINYEALWHDLCLPPAQGPAFENFTFTAISAAIFSRSDERAYSTTVYLYEQIPCGSETWTPGIGEVRSRPTFFFRPARDGYQFGVHVQREWWSVHRTELAPSIRQAQLSYGNDVVLAFLPYGYIPDHVRRWNEPVSSWYPFNWQQRHWTRVLQRHGWTSHEHSPERIDHRYVGIGYMDI